MAHVIRFDEGFRWDSGLYWDQLVPDHPPKKGARMPSDFIPQNWAAYRAWLLNLKTKIATLGASFGLTSGQITSAKKRSQNAIGLHSSKLGGLSRLVAELENENCHARRELRADERTNHIRPKHLPVGDRQD